MCQENKKVDCKPENMDVNLAKFKILKMASAGVF